MTQDKIFGNGPALDENFDFVAGPSGDLKNFSGVNELEKDLALSFAVQLQDYIGKPLTPTVRQKVKNSAESVLDAEPRIASVVGISVTETDYGFDIETQAVTEDGDKRFVIPVREVQ